MCVFSWRYVCKWIYGYLYECPLECGQGCVRMNTLMFAVTEWMLECWHEHILDLLSPFGMRNSLPACWETERPTFKWSKMVSFTGNRYQNLLNCPWIQLYVHPYCLWECWRKLRLRKEIIRIHLKDDYVSWIRSERSGREKGGLELWRRCFSIPRQKILSHLNDFNL